ncbi:SAM-dependent methyltransferase [Halorubrum sp. 48-1-W]|uniref:small ribosomal subunit Rsm22 family protein n=1 Tax=Halorubrum sp. 48-1-W TaxID=2249761 RepID=UPI000DCB7AB6|nr:class I SAM-dependent methyltransferase [Halorubrum sp. 48-1-W]RAW46186.1 SAM-dependent methyltransferase [Halorubrum sp. 48-1-W]
MIDRTAVRDTANYLRQVRPIDPEEITEYIEGTPHPAVVRETLREEAFDLRLREREDGSFVPVDDDPIRPPGWAPDALPEAYAFALEDLLVSEFGANWHVGDSGDELRETIRRLKADYLYGNDVRYDRIVALGYAVYHLPDYYAVIGYVLDDLAENGLLDRTLRVLDVGAGVGGPALGLHDYLPDDAVVEYHAVEPSANADVLDRLLEETGPNFRSTVHRTTAESLFGLEDEEGENSESEDAEDDSPDRDAILEEPFDLVLFGNVLSELSDPVTVLESGIDVLAGDGSVVALAPADRETAIGLRELERAVTTPGSGVDVYSPTLRLWADAVPSDLGWSFDVRGDLAVPPFQRRLDEAADRGPTDEPGEFHNVDVQFAYSILRTDGTRRVDVRASDDRCARMADSEEHVTDRVNLLAVKLSHDLSDGANAVYRVGDGSQSVDHYLVCTRETVLNDGLREADYGAVLFVENGLVLWNDDEVAYNVVVDDETVVDVVAP